MRRMTTMTRTTKMTSSVTITIAGVNFVPRSHKTAQSVGLYRITLDTTVKRRFCRH
jgi:hypothetical protein